MSITYGSVCSGIEAASVAWKPFSWATSFVSEIDAAPRAVLQHRFPEVPLHGDFTTIRESQYGAIDLLVGGTPCQSFSVAGLRGGLADDRGNLALQYLRLAQRLRPRWLVWENVPGVLSSSGGRDFGAILGGMVELGYGFAYRVLDAQYVRVDGFGRAVPQRRRRVFVVGHLGDWRRPAAVLLERASLRGDPAPRREAGAGIAIGALAGTGPGGGWRIGPDEAAGGQLVAQNTAPTLDAAFGRLQGASGQDLNHGHGHLVAFGGNDTRGPIDVATACNAHPSRHDFESETFIAFQQGGSNVGTTGSVCNTLTKGNGNESGGVPCIAWTVTQDSTPLFERELSPALKIGTGLEIGQPPAVAFNWQAGGDETSSLKAYDYSPTLTKNQTPAMAHVWSVRRLTPTECERLQGFPDGHTLVPWRGGLMPDGPRYKMLGNSMACNVMRWIGRRIETVNGLEVAPALMAAE